MSGIVAILGAALLASCSPGSTVDRDASADRSKTETHADANPSTVLRAPTTMADGLEVIVSDVTIPAGQALPKHRHPGEEFVYVLEGSAVHVEEGQPDRLLTAGESLVISPGALHTARGGPDGARAVIVRLHPEGTAERVPADGAAPSAPLPNPR